jgi:hypothetical protein
MTASLIAVKQILTRPSNHRQVWASDPHWRHWVQSKPAHVQAAIEKFPPGTIGFVQGGKVWVMGWTEMDVPEGEEPSIDHIMLIFSRVNPFVDYEEAQKPENVRRACTTHFDVRDPEES